MRDVCLSLAHDIGYSKTCREPSLQNRVVATKYYITLYIIFKAAHQANIVRIPVDSLVLALKRTRHAPNAPLPLPCNKLPAQPVRLHTLPTLYLQSCSYSVPIRRVTCVWRITRMEQSCRMPSDVATYFVGREYSTEQSAKEELRKRFQVSRADATPMSPLSPQL